MPKEHEERGTDGHRDSTLELGGKQQGQDEMHGQHKEDKHGCHQQDTHLDLLIDRPILSG